MNLLTDDIERTIDDCIIQPLLTEKYATPARHIPNVLAALYANIPEKQRISYGKVHTVKILAENVYAHLHKQNAPTRVIAAALFDTPAEYRTTCVAIGILSLWAVDEAYEPVLPYFEQAAASAAWELREMAQMFCRKIIKTYPDDMHAYFLRLAHSDDANIRRFVAEGLRPCIENQWFYTQPEYPLSILRHLFRESDPYPRTSVGNNLSDLARRLPELIYGLVAELVASEHKNSYWIAYRACRNLVKKEPLCVLDLLNTDEYRYKTRVYTRRDDQSN